MISGLVLSSLAELFFIKINIKTVSTLVEIDNIKVVYKHPEGWHEESFGFHKNKGKQRSLILKVTNQKFPLSRKFGRITYSDRYLSILLPADILAYFDLNLPTLLF